MVFHSVKKQLSLFAGDRSCLVEGMDSNASRFLALFVGGWFGLHFFCSELFGGSQLFSFCLVGSSYFWQVDPTSSLCLMEFLKVQEEWVVESPRVP